MTTPIRHEDWPGLWHHVCTRALSRRPYFEVDEDFEFMSERIGRVVDSGRLEVHAYSFMTNHLHLLVRSPKGELSGAMRDILGPYTRRFNRRRDRDGPLVKSRFFSRPMSDDHDRYGVVRYLDYNPYKAGMVRCILDYPHGSARHHAFGTGPAWLARSYVEEVVRSIAWRSCDPESYLVAFGKGEPASAAWRIEQRLLRGKVVPAEESALTVADEHGIREWFQAHARLADEAPIGYSIASAEALLIQLEAVRAAQAELTFTLLGRKITPWDCLTAGLLQIGSHCSRSDIAQILRVSSTTVDRRLRDHRRLLGVEPTYAALAASILHEELRDVGMATYVASRTKGVHRD